MCWVWIETLRQGRSPRPLRALLDWLRDGSGVLQGCPADVEGEDEASRGEVAGLGSSESKDTKKQLRSRILPKRGNSGDDSSFT